nr:phage tail fiber protein [uncultured Pseudodesulfovibrio sp.]
MTIASLKTKEYFSGNGSTRVFELPFMFMRDEDVEVLVSDAEGVETVQVLGSDYTLTGAGEQSCGVCHMSRTLQKEEVLFVRRSPVLTQEADYLENGAFPAASHEAALDKLTMICQALSERLDRTISLRISSAVEGLVLPEPAADNVLGWNAAQDNLENKEIIDFGQVAIPISVTQGGTGATNPTEALIGLGFGATGMAVSCCSTGEEVLQTIDSEGNIVRTLSGSLLKAVYGDEAQVHTGTDLSELVVERNHVVWTLTEESHFTDVSLPYDGTYVFHVYPAGYELNLAVSYKMSEMLASPNPLAGEIRVVVEQFNARKTILVVQNMEV